MDGTSSAIVWRSPGDATMAAALLRPGEQVLRASPAQATMPRAGLVAVAFAIPTFGIGGVPLRKAIVLAAAARAQPNGGLALALFAGFGLVWIAVGLRLLYEPVRLQRLYPHVFHVLTPLRILEIDRRSGLLHDFALAEIWRMKTFSPFGRLTLWRRSYATGTGSRSRTRNFDGVAEVETLAQAIAELTGVPVGQGQAAVARSLARMPPNGRPRQ